VLTAGGISAESGIPTFRDALTGLWAQFDPEDLASRDGFRANPKWSGSGMSSREMCAPAARILRTLRLPPGERFEQFVIVNSECRSVTYSRRQPQCAGLHGRILENRCFGEDRTTIRGGDRF